MKQTIIFLIAIFVFSHHAISQCYQPGCNVSTYPGGYDRAMYVNDFMKFQSNGNPDLAFSILGEPADEAALLNYCTNNNFNLIYLYNFHNIYSHLTDLYPGSGQTYGSLLVNFISSAHAANINVGIAIGSRDNAKKIFWWNGNKEAWKCTAVKENPNIALAAINEAIGSYAPEEYNPYLETTKQLIELYIYNNYYDTERDVLDLKSPIITCNSSTMIDRIITEYEFYQHKLPDGSTDYDANTDDFNNNYMDILNYSSCLQSISPCPYMIDTYLGWLNKDNISDQDQAIKIDNKCDRVYLHAYRCNPESMFGYIENRFILFGDASTKPNSEVWPIFSNEKAAWPGVTINKQDFLGDYLTDPNVNYNPNGGYTMACAEDEFFNDYASSTSSSLDNIVGGVLWFTYTNMRDYNMLRKRHSETENNIDFVMEENILKVWNNEPFKLTVFNTLGQTIFTKSNLNGKISIDLNGLTSGIYNLVIEDSNHQKRLKFLLTN